MIRFYGPGGGGRGNPLERDPARVLRDVEREALGRGLRLHLEDRVFIHGNKTVVFAD